MVHVTIFAELAEPAVIRLDVDGVGQQLIQGTGNVVAVLGQGCDEVGIGRRVVEGVGSAVALAVAIAELVAELQVGAVGNGFAVGQSCCVVARAVGCRIIAVVDVASEA